jgi:hypothetical protein
LKIGFGFLFLRIISLIFVSLLFFSGCTRLDKTHLQACNQLVNLAQNIDALLADPQEDEEYHKTRLKLSGGVTWEQGEGARFSSKGKVKIPLPGLKERWGVLIGGESEKEGEDLQDIPDIDNRSYESFLRFFSREESFLNWDFDVGFRNKNGLQTFLRLKGRHSGWFHCSRTRFIQYFYWRSDEGFVVKSHFNMDHRLTSEVLLREFTEMEYGEETDGLEIKGGVSLRALPRKGLVWSINMVHFGTTDPWGYQYTEMSFRIRKSLFRPWLEVEITPVFKLKRSEGFWKLEPRIETFLSITFDAIHEK